MFRWSICLLFSLYLAGCATQTVNSSHPPTDAITVFSLTGRLAVRQGETQHHMKIDWQHTPVGDEILLSTPLGQGVAAIVRDADGIRLTLADRREFTAATGSALATRVFGFPLPLDAPARWLLGNAPDDRDAVDGWQIRVVTRENATPTGLPTLIELERDDIEVRLKIDAWSDLQ